MRLWTWTPEMIERLLAAYKRGGNRAACAAFLDMHAGKTPAPRADIPCAQ